MAPKRKPSYKHKHVKKEFDVDEESSIKIIKSLYALDTINNNPISLYLNTPGGHCSDGLAIIDAMRTISSPVVTIITNEVCSMGGHISVAGNKRVCYKNSVWMAHDMYSYIEDYSGKIKDRSKFIERYYNILENNLRKYTKLTNADLSKARNGELWLFADEMLDKGIVDEIISNE